MDVSDKQNATNEEIVPSIPTQSTNVTQVGNFKNENLEKARWILLWIALLFAIFGIIVFMAIRDYRALSLELPMVAVYGFYFSRKGQH